jgi:hypothetical protein
MAVHRASESLGCSDRREPCADEHGSRRIACFPEAPKEATWPRQSPSQAQALSSTSSPRCQHIEPRGGCSNEWARPEKRPADCHKSVRNPALLRMSRKREMQSDRQPLGWREPVSGTWPTRKHRTASRVSPRVPSRQPSVGLQHQSECNSSGSGSGCRPWGPSLCRIRPKRLPVRIWPAEHDRETSQYQR